MYVDTCVKCMNKCIVVPIMMVFYTVGYIQCSSIPKIGVEDHMLAFHGRWGRR